MPEPARISPGEARQNLEEGCTILVCAYDDEKKFNQAHLKGAISLTEFKSGLASLSEDKEIIFYCA